MGYMDESGLLYYTDRLTRMYTSGGFNIYPPHIEEVILKLDEIEIENLGADEPIFHDETIETVSDEYEEVETHTLTFTVAVTSVNAEFPIVQSKQHQILLINMLHYLQIF